MTLTKLLNWTMKLACLAPLFFWVAGVYYAWLGAEPLVKINTQSGYVVLILLNINLAVGALKALSLLKFDYYSFIYQSRRFLGIMCGFYVILHFLTYLAKESFLPKGFEQIITKNYLTAGAIAASIILILTLTSNDISVRRLKKKWKFLHRMVYFAAFVMLFHIFQIEKANLLLLQIIVFPVLILELIRFIKAARSRSSFK